MGKKGKRKSFNGVRGDKLYKILKGSYIRIEYVLQSANTDR